MNGLGGPEILILGFVGCAAGLVYVIPLWLVLRKMGLPGPLALVPIGGIVLLIVLAIVEWPVLRELREARAKLSRVAGSSA